jgi:quercetin dioxygenase-like cupin family protein
MEITRREAFITALLPLLQAASVTRAQGQPQAADNSVVFDRDLPDITMDGWHVNASVITFPPGRVGAPHHHPGFVLVYVLEGDVVTKISGQEERTYSAGQMFYEQPGSTHEVSRNASSTKQAKILAMIFAKKGAPLVTPACIARLVKDRG